MVVQHNLTAMNSNRMLGLTTSAQAKSTEKLSSGYKINRAADDAAGLSISEKMRRQIRGLTQASANAQDGISAVQTAEGALTEVHDMLQRMDELATKAANGTMTTDDRQAIQDEIDQLVSEIDRVSETTTFNELSLLKGDGKTTEEVELEVAATEAVAVQATYQTGYGEDNGVALKDGETAPTWYLGGSSVALTDAELLECFEVDDDGNVVIKDGVALYEEAADTGSQWGAQVTEITDTDVQALYEAASTKVASDNSGTLVDEAGLADYFNTDGTYKGGLYYKNDSGTWTEIGADRIGEFVNVVAGSEATEASTTTETREVTKALAFNLHVGAESASTNKINVTIESMSASGIGIDVLSGSGVMDEASATSAIDIIKDAISKVSTQRSALGAVQNRLEHTINNLDNVVENTTSAESQIRDTDMATEMVNYSNYNILAQAGQAMLAQSNQSNKGLFSLLGL